MNDSESEWEKLLKASKPACRETPGENRDVFTRIEGLREAVHAIGIAMTWRRLTLIALAIAALLLAAMFLKTSRNPETPSLIVPVAPNEIMSP